MHYFIGGANEVSDVMTAIECEAEADWTFASKTEFCREHVPVPVRPVFVSCHFGAADLGMKLVKTKLSDIDADNPVVDLDMELVKTKLSDIDADNPVDIINLDMELMYSKCLDIDADNPHRERVSIVCFSEPASKRVPSEAMDSSYSFALSLTR